jgi:hypothetical protein
MDKFQAQTAQLEERSMQEGFRLDQVMSSLQNYKDSTFASPERDTALVSFPGYSLLDTPYVKTVTLAISIMVNILCLILCTWLTIHMRHILILLPVIQQAALAKTAPITLETKLVYNSNGNSVRTIPRL